MAVVTFIISAMAVARIIVMQKHSLALTMTLIVQVKK